MRFRYSVVLVCAVAGTAAATWAKAQSLPAGARDTLAAAVVTATRLDIATASPTSTATVLRGDDLRAQGITRMADALRLVPGAFVVGSGSVGSQTSLFLRGGNSNYVRVLVDGVPLNDAGGFVDLANFTTDNVDRIEVVRGPASVLYGSDAVTGVIQVFTRTGSGPAAWRSLVGHGTRGTAHVELGVSGRANAVRYSLLGSRHATDGMHAFNNRFATDVLSGAVALAPGRRTYARLAARWSAATFHYPTDYAGTIEDRNAEQADHRFTASADVGRQLTSRIELRALLTSNEFLPRSNDGADTPGDTLGFYGFFSRSTRTRRAADIRANVRVGARATFTVGAEFVRDREASSSLSLSEYGRSPGRFEAARHTTGVYVQAVGDASDRWSYAVGMRRDDNSAFGAFTTSRASVAWNATSSVRLRAASGTGFKAPSFFENFAKGYVVGNPALRPERSRGVEFGVDAFLFAGQLTVGAAVYRQRFSDIIQYIGTASAPGAPNYVNVAAANADGVEFSASFRPHAHVTLGASYAWTDTRVTGSGFDSTAGASYVAGERLIRRPPHMASVTAAWQGGAGDELRIVVSRVGERGDRDFAAFPVTPITLPAYGKIDVSSVFRLSASRDVALVVRADNLLDARYEEVARFRAPPRTLFGGIRVGR